MKESPLWQVVVTWVLTIYANLIFVVLWLGFVAALAVNTAWLDILWDWVQALPPVPELIVWLLLLPVMVGLWIWESTWALIWRIIGFAGIIAWTLVAISNLPKIFLMRVKR
ncbi:MAG: hypothetical protein JW757_08935 [Anaerolineales bacterium]|nr:hypothetical protein [Anaerolineales bacterium]